MPQPDDLPPHNHSNKRKKMPDESVLTIHLMNGTVRSFAFYEGSPYRTWYLSPLAIVEGVKHSLTIKYANGERIQFPLMNIESYHIAPRERTSHCELTGDLSCPQPMSKPASRCELCTGCLDPKHHPAPSIAKVKGNAETPPAVHD